MPAKGKVSLLTQTLFCFIPVLDLYAAYRIKKLRRYIVIMMLVIIIPISIASAIFIPTDYDDPDGVTKMLTFYYGVEDAQDEIIFAVTTNIATVLFAIFLIRRWSNSWNAQFDTDQTNEQQV